VSVVNKIFTLSLHRFPPQDGGIFHRLDNEVWNSLIKMCTCYYKGRNSSSEKQNSFKAPKLVFCYYGVLIITFKLVGPASYTFNFRNTTEYSCKDQSSMQHLPPCKHMSLPHIQYCKFCKTVINVSLEQANLLWNIISHSIFKYGCHIRIIMKWQWMWKV